MDSMNDAPPIGLGTVLRALLAQLEPAVENAYSTCDPLMRSRYYPVMRELLVRQQATVGEIAEAAGVSQPAMTQTIRQMSEDGLLEIGIGDDRRARLVKLSARGELAVASLQPAWRAVAEAARGLGDDAGLDLIASLQGVLDALDEKDFSTRIAEARGAGA
ncbi:MarR family winged helix-turn-helix transcriptional regulator [Qipengyuania sp. 1NDH17]|uniref:MarR family winged helix-turn-helix transcriptional regulator n=1 Tax=Qipengyuania polymorpha TaxID=2867234 RepID=A0ABS7IYM4_9SPHN|nr:MarR family winged helix-turn-helix transcriptional regulator [Qipengyuania polymorpha]MBX7457165.1 MarR family winged helix-turn-helix transcriptional regulator [Qipengyuania polymorpha]